MTAPEAIYLEPPEDSDDYEGQLWCEDDDPGGTGHPWTKYVRADLARAETLAEVREALLAHPWLRKEDIRTILDRLAEGVKDES